MSTQENNLKAIADAIREMDGSTGSIEANDFPDRIRAIQTGPDTQDATAAAGDILSGKTAYVKGQKITGTIASKGSADLTASGPTVTAPAGYYPSGASKSVETVSHPAPTQALTLGTYATIRASHAQGAGYVNAGTTTHDYNVSRHAGGTYTPGSSSQLLLNAGMWYLNNALYMGAIPSASPEEGTAIPYFGADGSSRAVMWFNLSLSGHSMIALFPNVQTQLVAGQIIMGAVGCSNNRCMMLNMSSNGRYYGVGSSCVWQSNQITFYVDSANATSEAWRYLLV